MNSTCSFEFHLDSKGAIDVISPPIYFPDLPLLPFCTIQEALQQSDGFVSILVIVQKVNRYFIFYLLLKVFPATDKVSEKTGNSYTKRTMLVKDKTNSNFTVNLYFLFKAFYIFSWNDDVVEFNDVLNGLQENSTGT